MRYQALVAEFIGTFALIFVGVLSIVAATSGAYPPGGGGGSLATIALAHGLTIAVMVSATAAVSGGHLNPAVTLGFMVTRRMPVVTGLAYMVAQFLGAVVGSVAVGRIVLSDWLVNAGYGIPSVNVSIRPINAMWMEAILTFFLVFVIFGTAVDKRAPKVGGLFIGLTIALGIMIAGPMTGGAINPARWFGPALVNMNWENAYVYLAGPFLGGAVGALVYHHILGEKTAEPATA
jgi:aquaporin Z